MLGTIDPGLRVTAKISHHDITLNLLDLGFSFGRAGRVEAGIHDSGAGASELVGVLLGAIGILRNAVSCATGGAYQVVLVGDVATVARDVLSTLHL